jgi:hypothetical protein
MKNAGNAQYTYTDTETTGVEGLKQILRYQPRTRCGDASTRSPTYTDTWLWHSCDRDCRLYVGYDGVTLTSKNCGLYGFIIHLWVTAMWTMLWWYRLGLTPNLPTRALWQPPVMSDSPVSRDVSGASRKIGEWNVSLVYPSSCDFKTSLKCYKILAHGTSGFTSHLKEGVLRIFIALENPSSWPGSNRQPLGPVASTLTTTSPRRICDRDSLLNTMTELFK